MSDYANAVTQPFWERHLPEVAAYFRKNEWAESRSDKNSLAFSIALRDLSEAGLNNQIFCVCLDISKLLPSSWPDFHIVLIHEDPHYSDKKAEHMPTTDGSELDQKGMIPEWGMTNVVLRPGGEYPAIVGDSQKGVFLVLQTFSAADADQTESV